MVSSEKAGPGSAWPLLMAIPVLLALMVASAWWQRRPRVQNPVSEAPPVRRLITGKAVKPAPAPQGYVGSQACAKCHASIAESYAAHPMYRSAGATPGSDDLEDFVNTEFKSPDGRIYRVAKEDDGIYHHELLLDNDGELLYDEAAKISFFIGSGTLGKSYAIDRGGILFQSPISWYASDKKWDLSPGYSRRHPRFGRRILDHCVICHAGRPNLDPDRDNCFVEPVLIEAAIGCERCHGPGERHIALHETPGLAQSDDPIVNPARLDHDRREAVCYQCHLIGKMRFARYGRTFDDFRPGDRLDDVWTTLVEGTGVRSDGKTKAVSHVQQMRDSTCFKKSEGRLGCTSCHDPHSVPAAGEASAYFRQRCLECHADQGCSLPAEQQAAAPANDSCAYCHMPRLSAHDVAHASQTDHRILRLQETDDRDLHPPSERETLVVFDEEHTSMPAWELERAKALAKATQIEEAGYASAAMADELQQTLQMIVDIAPDDFRALSALAGTEEVRLNHALARDTWQRALELRPDDETMLDVLASVCQTMGDFQAGLDYSDRLIELNPWRSGDYLRRAIMLSQFGRWPEATADGEMAVKLDPSDKHARRWLSEAYERLGNLEASRRHADVLKRMSALTVAP